MVSLIKKITFQNKKHKTWKLLQFYRKKYIKIFSISHLTHSKVKRILTSISNDLLEPPDLAKLTFFTSSYLMKMGGLYTKMNPRSSGYTKPDAALYEHEMAGVPEWPTKLPGTVILRPTSTLNRQDTISKVGPFISFSSFPSYFS